jgi:GntR family transcriptional repressor for pyruvate dehydrogenase complex
VADQLTDLILKKRLQPGEKLPPERQLAGQFGVSRNAVREAMKALEQKGLVELRQGAGTFVLCLTPETVSESLSLYFKTNVTRYLHLMDLREILDVEIASRLAKTIEPKDLEKLQQDIEKLQQLIDSPREYAEQDVAFHMDFYRAAKNEVLLMIMDPIMELLVETMAASFEMPGSAESSLRRHEKLVECLAAGDAEQARKVTIELIKSGKKRLTREP